MSNTHNLWKAIAISGIWIGVGIVGTNDAFAAIIVSYWALLATVTVIYKEAQSE